MKLRKEGWAELFDDEDRGGLLVPILALAHEHDPDPGLRPYKEPMNGKSWCWASRCACPQSTFTFVPDAVYLRKGSGREDRIAAQARRWGGTIRARAGQARSSRSAAGQ